MREISTPMIVKNITSSPQAYQLGYTFIQLAAGAEGVVDDEVSTVASAVEWQTLGILQVVSGPVNSAFEAPVSVPGYRLINLASVVQGNTVTLSGTSVAGVAFSVTFEFRTSGDPTAGNVAVLIGANTAAAGDNLHAAINANATLSALRIKATASVSKATTNSTVTVECQDLTKVLSTDLVITPVGGTITAGTAELGTVETTRRVAYVTKTAIANENFVVTGLASVEDYILQVRRAGALITYSGTIIVDGGTIFLDDNATALQAGDIISLFVTGA
jgi:hypothetical protein